MLETIHERRVIITVWLLAMTCARCGPPPEPATPPPPPPATKVDSQAMTAMATYGKYIPAHEMPYYAAVEKFNEAVWNLDKAKLAKAVTVATLMLLMEKATLAAQLAGTAAEDAAQDFLKMQQKQGRVFSIRTVDHTTATATVDLIANSKIVSSLTVKFASESGSLKMDLGPTMKAEIEQLKKTIASQSASKHETVLVEGQMKELLADLGDAITEGDEALFLSIVSDDTAELALLLVKLLPPAQGGSSSPTIGHYLDWLSMTISQIDLVVADIGGLEAEVLVHPPIGPTTSTIPGPPDVREFEFVLESGRLVLDLASILTSEVEKVAEATGHIGPFEDVLVADTSHVEGDVEGSMEHAFVLAASGDKKKAKKARKTLAKICKAQNVSEQFELACARLAQMMLDGTGGPVDETGARNALEKACIDPADIKSWQKDVEGAVTLDEPSCVKYGDMILAGQGGPSKGWLAQQLFEKICFGGYDEGCVANASMQLAALANLQPWGLDQAQEFDLVSMQFEMSCAQAPLRCIQLGNDILTQIQDGQWYGDARDSVLELANDVLLNP